MVLKKNCWEIKACGREPGGAKVAEMGVCPAATMQVADGINGGKNAGRVCWAVAGTFCGGKIQGSFAEKQTSCLTCDVHLRIKSEEGTAFRLLLPGQTYRRATAS